ncbi:MAG: DUF1049 domain-containing protein [Xanthomonadales bacterium]|nr:DUF1049 domain-containing protein [Xanthomonadales bacterium]
MRLFKRIAVGLMLVIVAIFAAMNPNGVELDLLAVQLQAPIGVALIGAFLAGMLCGALLVLLKRPARTAGAGQVKSASTTGA